MNREDLEHGPYQRCAKAARRGTLAHPRGADADCVPPPQPAFSDRLNASVRANAARPAYWEALIAEKQAWADATPAALRAAGRTYGDLPLLILAADGSNAYLPPDLRKPMDAAWQASYARLAAYSTRGVVVPVAHSSHNMFDDQPDAIVDAVTRLIGELRRKRAAD
jgi:pimeloyl-ACP methyl ester carboxylesterase